MEGRQPLHINEIPVYVINLDRRPDRWTTFSSQPALKKFEHLNRFSAVNGSTLDIPKDARVSVHTRMNIAKKYRRSHYEINTPGAIGASLSHIGIWKTFLQTEAPYCLVFEDDTVFTEEILAEAKNLSAQMPTQWDIWLLGHHRWAMESDPLTQNGLTGWRRVKGFTGAHAYIINRRAATLLLEECFPIETHIEYYITGTAALKNLTILRHSGLRVPYEIEFTEGDDSDTFDSMKSCPLCRIPDNFLETHTVRTNQQLARAAAGIIALSIIGTGAYIAWQHASAAAKK